MPDLIKSLQGRDLGHLKIVAQLWGVELAAPSARAALHELVPWMLSRDRIGEITSQLPTEARAALEDLASQEEERLLWALFARRYGTVREMGPGRRDRDQPYLNPISPAEVLWYRGLIGRAFFDTPNGPEEFAYIPEDLAAWLPEAQANLGSVPGRPASPAEKAYLQPADDRILDHACSLLAALRLGFSQVQMEALEASWHEPASRSTSLPAAPNLRVRALKALLEAADLVDATSIPLQEPRREFLEAERGTALRTLARAWLHSSRFNELRLLPNIRPEGEWENDPLRARQCVLDFMAAIPTNETEAERPFWSLDSFVEAIRQAFPDFQRPAGDYDSWYLWDETQAEYLRGFQHWERVEGGLIRFIITGPMHWLGITDLAWSADPQEDERARLTGFRLSRWGEALLHGQAPEGLPVENAQLQVRSDAVIVAPRLVPRAVRYQIARFCEWEAEKTEAYTYRLTPGSLVRARQQSLTTNHLLRILQRHAKTVAPSLVRAIERWERAGVETHLEQVTILRLSTPELLQSLRGSKAARFLGDPLGPTSVVVKPGAMGKVLDILAEMGYLGQVEEG